MRRALVRAAASARSGRTVQRQAARRLSEGEQSTADTAESLESLPVRQAGLVCMVDAWLAILTPAASGRSRA